jgi:sugar/nucleoside kinase (ribokinase family)
VNILIAGELNVDLVLQNYSSFPALGREVLVEDVSLTLGSASAICASALAKLGDSVSLIGQVGQDAWGDLCVNSLATAGVDCSLIIRQPALKTGITVSISSSKDRALVTYLGSIAELHAGDIQDEHLKRFNHLHVSSFFLQRGLRPELKSLLARAHEQGLTTSLDPGFDPENTWGQDLIDVLNEVDVFLPNEVELEALTHNPDADNALRTLQNGRTLIVAKLGARGCMTLHKEELFTVPAFPVGPVDTTGAGDTFNAGFLHAWLVGDDLRAAMRFAAACGALSTLAAGGSSGQPTAAQAHEFMALFNIQSGRGVAAR